MPHSIISCMYILCHTLYHFIITGAVGIISSTASISSAQICNAVGFDAIFNHDRSWITLNVLHHQHHQSSHSIIPQLPSYFLFYSFSSSCNIFLSYLFTLIKYLSKREEEKKRNVKKNILHHIRKCIHRASALLYLGTSS